MAKCDICTVSTLLLSSLSLRITRIITAIVEEGGKVVAVEVEEEEEEVVVVHFSPHCIFHQAIYSGPATQGPTLNRPNLE